MNVTDLYIDLLKKTLVFGLWDEPGMPVKFLPADKIGRRLNRGLSAWMERFGYQITKLPKAGQEERDVGASWPGMAHSMVGMRRLDNIQECVETVLRDNIPGDLIETGVWRGGSVILMKGILAAHGARERKVFVADSFEGLPPPDAKQYPEDEGDKHHTFKDYLGVSRRQVEESFRRFGLLDDNVVFLEGWFKDTLPTAPIERLAVMRLDGDMYESTIQAIEALYPKLQPGGFCIVDDFSHPACGKAISDYRAKHGISAEIVKIDWSGAYWRK
jgi:O-methyltransferase